MRWWSPEVRQAIELARDALKATQDVRCHHIEGAPG